MSIPPDPLRSPRPVDRWRIAGIVTKVLLWMLAGMLLLWLIGGVVYQRTGMDDF